MLVSRYVEQSFRAAALDRQWIQVIPQSPIKPRWGDYPISKVNPFAVEQWFEGA